MKTAIEPDAALIGRLSVMQPEDVLRWAYENHGDRVGIITSFQDTGCVMVDMASRVAPDTRILTIDTKRLHPETYQLIDAIESRYDIKIERFHPDEGRTKQMVERHGEFLFFDSKAKQEYCCQIRKVEPNVKALQTVDVWITGLRRDHSESRGSVPKAEYIDGDWGKILKLAPLADWDAERVRDYIADNDVPYNKLYDQGYTSIGCVICSTPTQPWEDVRAGRWRWFNALDDDKECGIHTNVGGAGI